MREGGAAGVKRTGSPDDRFQFSSLNQIAILFFDLSTRHSSVKSVKHFFPLGTLAWRDNFRIY
jgi:hypothetical protein